MRKPIIFLDIDGVLNGHEYNNGAQSCTIKQECVEHFNHILLMLDAEVVLSSAWRYLIANNAMTLGGFAVMLRTHGVHHSISQRLIGITPTDEETAERPDQIRSWLSKNPKVSDFIVIDDLMLDWGDLRDRVVQTDELHGLTKSEAELAINLIFPNRARPSEV